MGMKYLPHSVIINLGIVLAGFLIGGRDLSRIGMNTSEPYIELLGSMVAVLSLLVTFLAIGSAIIIYRQSTDYKESFAKTADAFFSEQRVKIEATVKQLENDLEDTQKKLKTSTGKLTPGEKTKLEERIKRLESERDRINYGTMRLFSMNRVNVI